MTPSDYRSRRWPNGAMLRSAATEGGACSTASTDLAVRHQLLIGPLPPLVVR